MVSESELREAFHEYMDVDGLISDKKNPGRASSGNLLLYTSHYVWTLERRGFWDYQDLLSIRKAVDTCRVEPGIFQRCPYGISQKENQQGPDDYIGLISMSGADERLSFAKEILTHGRTQWCSIGKALELDGHTILAKLFGWIKIRWIFNTVLDHGLTRFTFNPDGTPGPLKSNWGAWFGRFPSIIAHAQFAAGEDLAPWRPWIAIGLVPFSINLAEHTPWLAPLLILGLFSLALGFRRLMWCYSLFTAGRGSQADSTDPWILTWHLAATYRASGHNSFICELAFRNFMRRLFAHWPGGLNSVYLKYWGADHPVTRYFIS